MGLTKKTIKVDKAEINNAIISAKRAAKKAAKSALSRKKSRHS